MTSTSNRRQFLQTSAAGLGVATLGANPGFWSAPSAKLRVLSIGVIGTIGAADRRQISSHPDAEIVGLCDVDSNALAKAKEQVPEAFTCKDYREAFAAHSDKFDAVIVSTPDHSHAPIMLTAMQHSKHVYGQKPLVQQLEELVMMERALAARPQLVTQLGNQRMVYPGRRAAVEILRRGLLGKAIEAHCWTGSPNPGRYFNYESQLGDPSSPPKHLDWNLWLGTASMRPYHASVYHPGNWRKLIDFGTGTLGDMGVHIFDTPYDALALTAPNWAETTCRPPTGVGHPERNIVQYEFPGTDFTTDTLIWTWYDGADAPPKDLDLPAGLNLPGQGSLFIGEEGTLLLPHVGEARLFPEERFKDYQRPEVPNNNHYHQWVNACLGEGKTSADFSYAGPLTEALLLGVVANRFPGQRLEWDAENLKVTNVPEANSLITHNYREDF
ncbi:MAG: Gfo/Idh/MocA family oxidoreductase [Pirellulales bacterium]|nr:Gfo/Idh/MocA family oxidoreductase [Pirellulales bacterium]